MRRRETRLVTTALLAAFLSVAMLGVGLGCQRHHSTTQVTLTSGRTIAFLNEDVDVCSAGYRSLFYYYRTPYRLDQYAELDTEAQEVWADVRKRPDSVQARTATIVAVQGLSSKSAGFTYSKGTDGHWTLSDSW